VNYVAIMKSGSVNPLFDNQVAFLFTGDRALPTAPGGWKGRIIYTDSADTKALWGR